MPNSEGQYRRRIRLTALFPWQPGATVATATHSKDSRQENITSDKSPAHKITGQFIHIAAHFITADGVVLDQR